MVVSTDPRSGSDHSDDDNDQSDDTPCEDDRRSVLGYMVLEGADDEENEPSNTRNGAA